MHTELQVLSQSDGPRAPREIFDWARQSRPRGEEQQALKRVYGLGLLGRPPDGLPVRAPHYSVTPRGMLGGFYAGRLIPGELSLAHAGVLLLDELEHFRFDVIEELAVALTCGHVLIERPGRVVALPAQPRKVVVRLGPEASWPEHLATCRHHAALLRACQTPAVA